MLISVPHHFLGCWTLTFAKPLWLLVLSLAYQILHYVLIVIVKGQTTTQQDVEDDSKRPHIGFDTQVLSTRQHFWTGVSGRPAESVHSSIISQKTDGVGFELLTIYPVAIPWQNLDPQA